MNKRNLAELEEVLSKDNPNFIVICRGKRLGIENLKGISGEEFVSNCSVIMDGENAYISKQQIREEISRKPTEKYILGYNWKNSGSSPGEHLTHLDKQSALDCLEILYNRYKCWDNIRKCWVK